MWLLGLGGGGLPVPFTYPHPTPPTTIKRNKQILGLKQELATLLGYKNYAEVSLASKMAPSIEAVQELFSFLREKSYPFAVKELAEVQAYANANG